MLVIAGSATVNMADPSSCIEAWLKIGSEDEKPVEAQERGSGAQIGVRPTPEPIIQQAFVLDSLQLQPSPSEWGV